jgi:hypothetical protein
MGGNVAVEVFEASGRRNVVLVLPEEDYAVFTRQVEAHPSNTIPVQIYGQGNDEECYSLVITAGHWQDIEAYVDTLTWVEDEPDETYE